MNDIDLKEGILSIHSQLSNPGGLNKRIEDTYTERNMLLIGAVSKDKNVTQIHVVKGTELDILRNEPYLRGSLSAQNYPLDIRGKEFYSDVLYIPNFVNYEHLIYGSIDIILSHLKDGYLTFNSLFIANKQIQDELDIPFALTQVKCGPDELHSVYGPNEDHPYSKITLLRTTVPIKIGSEVVPMYFEKFLVVYSYYDEKGNRKSAITPMHSHPINFEVSYITHVSDEENDSLVVETEYTLVDNRTGKPLLLTKSGEINKDLVDQETSGLIYDRIRTREGETSVMNSQNGNRVTRLTPLDSELQFYQLIQKSSKNLYYLEGLFRNHVVSVPAHIQHSTLNNYWSYKGTVFVYEKGRIVQWSQNDWETREE